MSDVVVCECGAKVRRPPVGVTAFRCPRCRVVISNAVPVPAIPLEGDHAAIAGGSGAYGYAAPPLPSFSQPPPPPILPQPYASPPPPPPQARVAPAKPSPPAHRASDKDVGAMCPICQSAVSEGETCVACPACHQIHHQECWLEVGGCATYGCKEAPALEKKAGPDQQQPLSAWGDVKTCPVCAQQIKSIAVKCRFCGTAFGTVDPLSRHDLHLRMERDKAMSGVRNTAVTIFVLSIIGVIAPIMAIVSLAWVLPKRKLLKQAGPVYLILGYSALGLSVLYSLLIVAVVLS